MTLQARLLGCFPIIHGLSIFGGITLWFRKPSLVGLIGVVFCIYGLPLICYRCHRAVYGDPEGIYDLAGSQYTPWWGGYQFQLLFNTFDGFEKLLRLFPGAYQMWLRLWGAKIGKKVFFTSRFRTLDRPHLDIGDGAVFGYDAGISSHVITPRNSQISLLVKKVTVGSGAFVGAHCYLAPGAVVGPDTCLSYGQKVAIDEIADREKP